MGAPKILLQDENRKGWGSEPTLTLEYETTVEF